MASAPLFPITPRPVRNLLGPLATPAAGMGREQQFIEVISANLANAEVTHTPEGGPYHRQIAVASGDASGAGSTEVMEDRRPGRVVYDPGHPDANADGYVEYPNVDVTNELVDLMIARRVHEANATVFQAAKAMLKSALEI